PVFILDEYTRRVFRRLDLFPEHGEAFWSGPYEKLREFFERHILRDLSLYREFVFAPGVSRDVVLLRDWHAQLVELGKHHCLKTNPRCRSTGNSCWRGFAAGETHCRLSACLLCPLGERCSFAGASAPGSAPHQE